MVINELIYLHSFNHTSGLSFLKFPNQTQKISDCETVVISAYDFDFNSEMYKTELIDFVNNGKKLIIDASTEIMGKNTIDFALRFEDTSLITIYVNNYETQFNGEIELIKVRGGNVVIIPFFIKYVNQYKPKYSNKPIAHKDYLLLSGKSKPSRTSMVGLLSYYNLIENGHVSFFGDGVTVNNSRFFYDKTSDYFSEVGVTETQKKKVREGLSKIPKKLTLDINNLTHQISHDRSYNGDYYKAVDFVVVVESDLRDDFFFVTEKTMKCIQQNKKFIVFGSCGLLNHIKKEVKIHLQKDITHLTDWCDTSYDHIGDAWERLDKIISIIKDNTSKSI